MKGLKSLSALMAVSVLAGCSTVGDRAKWNKDTDSVALQITKSAGSFDQFRDRDIPKEALNEMSALGYIGYTGLGMVFSTGVAGLGLALISDNTYGWELENYIMFLDASKFPAAGSVSHEKRDELIARYVSQAMYAAQPDLKTMPSMIERSGSSTDIDSYIFTNIASRLYQGWQVDMDPLHPCVYIDADSKSFVGTALSVYGYSSVLDTSEFSSTIQNLLPFKQTIAVRYMWLNSSACFAQQDSIQRNGINAEVNYYPSSPTLVLPRNTFVSLPKRVKIGDGKHLHYPSSVRDNENVYYFVKPIDGVSAKSPLPDFHQRFVEDPIKRELNQ